jgi:hypothetical protein
MEIFVCGNVFVPLRSGPSHKSEMLSQVLFGERYRITDSIGHWYKIITIYDNYAGWIDINHLQQSLSINDLEGKVLNRSLLCFKEDGTKLVLEAGCEIYEPDFENRIFTSGKDRLTAGPDFNISYIHLNESLTDTAMRFINSPYIWGGRIPSGIDCSGFVQLVYKLHNIKIPRDSYQQAETGVDVTFIDESLPGDLVFFDDDRRKISHVGMILAKGLVIHASGRVRIDSIDHNGIYKNEIRDYSHRLRMIKRIITK